MRSFQGIYLYPLQSKRPRVIYLTPWGHPFSQQMAEEFAKEEHLVFLCGHYEADALHSTNISISTSANGPQLFSVLRKLL